MEAREQPSEIRRFERTTVLWSGQLVYREQSVACVIVNISAGGAMVRSEDPAFYATSVVLRNSRIGDLAAEVLWRQDDELGLKFADDPETVAEIIGRALK
ncbi:MAG: PilZ domain-containing protein [Alphaproteobacteria bacterium]